MSGVVEIYADYSHTVFLKNDCTVWATGSNSNGQLGDGTNLQRLYPVEVKNSDGTGFTGVVDLLRSLSLVFLKSDGSVWATGDNAYGQLGDGTTTDRRKPVDKKIVMALV